MCSTLVSPVSFLLIVLVYERFVQFNLKSNGTVITMRISKGELDLMVLTLVVTSHH